MARQSIAFYDLSTNIISHLVSDCISFTAEMSEVNEILECPQEN